MARMTFATGWRPMSAWSQLRLAPASSTISPNIGSELAAGRTWSVATAASMDGYAASGAPLMSRLQTHASLRAAARDCRRAGDRRRCAGGHGRVGLRDMGKARGGPRLGDGRRARDQPIDVEAVDTVQENVGDWLAAPAAIGRRDNTATRRLMAGLIISGLAIQAHGNSRPASGSEHQFSHLWEMEGLAIDGVAAAHGACVGIGTLAMLAAYEWLIARDLPADAEPVGSPLSRTATALRARVERSLRRRGIRESAWIEAEAKRPTANALGERIDLVRLRRSGPISGRSSDEAGAGARDAGGAQGRGRPSTPADLGISAPSSPPISSRATGAPALHRARSSGGPGVARRGGRRHFGPRGYSREGA